MLGVGASLTTNWWVTTINPGESEHRLKIKGGSEIHEQSKTGHKRKEMSIRNKEGQAGERRAPKQRYEEQHVVITLSEKQPLQMCTWGLLLLMLVCDQRFSDLSRQNYTPGVSVKSEKTTPLEVPAGPLLCPPFGHSLFSVVSHVTCPSPFARGGCLAGEVRQEKWPDRPKIPRS